jgi:hypothetical protein
MALRKIQGHLQTVNQQQQAPFLNLCGLQEALVVAIGDY